MAYFWRRISVSRQKRNLTITFLLAFFGLLVVSVISTNQTSQASTNNHSFERPSFGFYEAGPDQYKAFGVGYSATIDAQGIGFSFIDGVPAVKLGFHQGLADSFELVGDGVDVNYLVGNEHSSWLHGSGVSERLVLKQVWPGVDIEIYHDQQGRLEYDLQIDAGVDISAIKFDYLGQGILSAEEQVLSDGLGFTHSIPAIFQVDELNNKVHLQGSYQIASSGDLFGLSVQDVDPSKDLIIDPVVEYTSVVGSERYFEDARAVAFDASGNMYAAGIAGNSNMFLLDLRSQSFATDGADARIYPSAGNNIFLMKYSPNGDLVWVSFIGGTGTEKAASGMGLAVGSDGGIWLASNTNSSDFPVTDDAEQRTLAGEKDGFLVKVSADGRDIEYGTYIGGTGDDRILNLLLSEETNRLYVVGWTQSDYPLFGQSGGGDQDAFVAAYALDSNNATVVDQLFAKRVGGASEDRATDIEISSVNGGLYVVGDTQGLPEGLLQGSFSSEFGGERDGMIMRISPLGDLESLGYFGGSGSDRIRAVAMDARGLVYIVGFTDSNDLPLAENRYIPGGWDAYLAVFDDVEGALELVVGERIGANISDFAFDVQIDNFGQVVLLGYSNGDRDSVEYSFDRSFIPQSQGTTLVDPNRPADTYDVWAAKWGGQLRSIDWLGSTNNTRGFRLALLDQQWLLGGSAETKDLLSDTPANPNADPFVRDMFIAKLLDQIPQSEVQAGVSSTPLVQGVYHAGAIDISVAALATQGELTTQLLIAPPNMKLVAEDSVVDEEQTVSWDTVNSYQLQWVPSSVGSHQVVFSYGFGRNSNASYAHYLTLTVIAPLNLVEQPDDRILPGRYEIEALFADDVRPAPQNFANYTVRNSNGLIERSGRLYPDAYSAIWYPSTAGLYTIEIAASLYYANFTTSKEVQVLDNVFAPIASPIVLDAVATLEVTYPIQAGLSLSDDTGNYSVDGRRFSFLLSEIPTVTFSQAGIYDLTILDVADNGRSYFRDFQVVVLPQLVAPSDVSQVGGSHFINDRFAVNQLSVETLDYRVINDNDEIVFSDSVSVTDEVSWNPSSSGDYKVVASYTLELDGEVYQTEASYSLSYVLDDAGPLLSVENIVLAESHLVIQGEIRDGYVLDDSAVTNVISNGFDDDITLVTDLADYQAGRVSVRLEHMGNYSVRPFVSFGGVEYSIDYDVVALPTKVENYIEDIDPNGGPDGGPNSRGEIRGMVIDEHGGVYYSVIHETDIRSESVSRIYHISPDGRNTVLILGNGMPMTIEGPLIDGEIATLATVEVVNGPLDYYDGEVYFSHLDNVEGGLVHVLYKVDWQGRVRRVFQAEDARAPELRDFAINANGVISFVYQGNPLRIVRILPDGSIENIPIEAGISRDSSFGLNGVFYWTGNEVLQRQDAIVRSYSEDAGISLTVAVVPREAYSFLRNGDGPAVDFIGGFYLFDDCRLYYLLDDQEYNVSGGYYDEECSQSEPNQALSLENMKLYRARKAQLSADGKSLYILNVYDYLGDGTIPSLFSYNIYRLSR